MDNIVATTLAFIGQLYAWFLFILLNWMEMHRYAYLIWSAALGGPNFTA